MNKPSLLLLCLLPGFLSFAADTSEKLVVQVPPATTAMAWEQRRDRVMRQGELFSLVHQGQASCRILNTVTGENARIVSSFPGQHGLSWTFPSQIKDTSLIMLPATLSTVMKLQQALNWTAVVAHPFFRWQSKDYLDQPLHILMGIWPILLAWYLVKSVALCLSVALINLAYLAGREYLQHPAVVIDLDLLFGFAGCIIGVVVVLLACRAKAGREKAKNGSSYDTSA